MGVAGLVLLVRLGPYGVSMVGVNGYGLDNARPPRVTLAFLALVGTAATTVAWFAEARRSRLDTLTAWTFLAPVLGIALASVALGERPGGWTAVGLLAVLAAMWITLRPPRRAPCPRRRSPMDT